MKKNFIIFLNVGIELNYIFCTIFIFASLWFNKKIRNI